MGYIDAECHVFEPRRAWSYFDPSEAEYAPPKSGPWNVGDLHPRTDFDPTLSMNEEQRKFYPEGATDLSNMAARIRHMDELGVDVQVVFSSFWITNDIFSPVAEAAMARSYNRWMADAAAESKGRLRWGLYAPARMMERSLQEMEFGKKHGAVAIHWRGVRNGFGVANPYYFPIYERAQDLDLTIAVHIGADHRTFQNSTDNYVYSNLLPNAGALSSLLLMDMHARFPRLRWTFLEAGATWVPYSLQAALRADLKHGTGSLLQVSRGEKQYARNWRDDAKGLLEANNLFVASYMDDDIPYLLQYGGRDWLMWGSDYSHADMGADPHGIRTLLNRKDLDPQLVKRILDDNPRKAYGIERDFRPADKAKSMAAA